MNSGTTHEGSREAEITRLKQELQESKEALETAINGLQEWCDDVDKDSSWDGWDSNFKYWKWEGLPLLREALAR